MLMAPYSLPAANTTWFIRESLLLTGLTLPSGFSADRFRAEAVPGRCCIGGGFANVMPCSVCETVQVRRA